MEPRGLGVPGVVVSDQREDPRWKKAKTQARPLAVSVAEIQERFHGPNHTQLKQDFQGNNSIESQPVNCASLLLYFFLGFCVLFLNWLIVLWECKYLTSYPSSTAPSYIRCLWWLVVDAAALLLFSLLLVLLVVLLISVFPGLLLLLLMCLVGAVVLMEGPRCCCLGTSALRGGMTGQGEKREMFRVSVSYFSGVMEIKDKGVE